MAAPPGVFDLRRGLGRAPTVDEFRAARAEWEAARVPPPERDPRDVYAIHVWRGPAEGLVELCTVETPEAIGPALLALAQDDGGLLDGLVGIRHVPDHRWIVRPFPRSAPTGRS